MYVMAISILNLAVTSEGTVPLAIRARADAMRAAGRGQRTRRLHGHHSPVTCGARNGQRCWAVSGGAGGQGACCRLRFAESGHRRGNQWRQRIHGRGSRCYRPDYLTTNR